MPLYFFNVLDGGHDKDPDGIELENFDTAKTEAVKLASVLIGESPDALIHGPGLRVEVTDENGWTKFTVMGFAVSSVGADLDTQTRAV